MQRLYIVLLSAAHLVTDLGTGALPALLPFFVLHYHLTYTEVAGLIFAASSLSSMVQPVFGLLADKTTNHWHMGLGVFLASFFIGMTGLVSDYWLIFAAVLIGGVGSSIFHPEAARFVNLISGDKKSTGVGIFSVGGNAGLGLGPLIVVASVGLWGLKGVIVFSVLGVLFGTALFLAIPALDRVALRCKEAEAKKHPSVGTNDWHSFFKLTLVIIGRSIVYCSMTAFFPLYCVRYLGVTESVAGTTLTVLACGCTVMTLVGGWLGDKIGLVRAMRLGALVLVPAIALLNACPNIWCVYVVLIIVSFGMNAPYASFVVLGQTYLAKNIGFASGVTLGLAFSVGGMFVPLLGKMADTYSLESVFMLLTALSALCAVGAFALAAPKKHKIKE